MLETRNFTIAIQTHNKNKYLFKLHNNTLFIFCPDTTDFESPETQRIISAGIKRFIKQEAEKYLPERLDLLAKQLNLTYNSVSVSHGRKRLGSGVSTLTFLKFSGFSAVLRPFSM